jgi:hypothetical protein
LEKTLFRKAKPTMRVGGRVLPLLVRVAPWRAYRSTP